MSKQRICDLCAKPIKEGFVQVKSVEYVPEVGRGSELEDEDYHNTCFAKLQTWKANQRFQSENKPEPPRTSFLDQGKPTPL